MESLINSHLETQHLYRQNAAMKHGVPDKPRRISHHAAETPTEPRKEEAKKWDVASVAKMIAAVIIGALGLQGAQALMKPAEDPPAMVQPAETPEAPILPPETLLEFLDREGLNR